MSGPRPTAAQASGGRTADLGRFNLETQADRGWLERADACVSLVLGLLQADPGISSVADIGCGDGKLSRRLAVAAPKLRCAGYDLLPQSGDVTPFDLGTDTLPVPVDIVILLGVTEYLADLHAALYRLAPRCRYLILSHVLRTPASPSPQRLLELGWRNHLERPALEQAVRDAGFETLAGCPTPDGKTWLLACRTFVSTA